MSDKTREKQWIYKGKTMDLQGKNNGFSKGLLLACKRVRFTLQKESFYTAKGLHLEGKRTPFEKAGENRLNA